MKQCKILVLMAALALTGAACGDDDDAAPPQETSLLRVIHNSPDAPEVDILFDDQIVLEDVPYLGASDYLTVPAGPANLKVAVAGTDMVVIDADAELAADVAYSVIAVNLVADIDAVILVDDLTPPDAGETRVRLMHGAPSAPTVDIYITGPDDPLGAPTLSGVPYLAVAEGLTVPSGTYRVRITPEGTQDVVIDTGALPLESGVAYTAIAVDAAGGGAPFGALLLIDEAPAE